MAVRIEKAHHALAPGVLFDRVDIVDIETLQLLREGIEIIFFKIQLTYLAALAQCIR